VFDSYSCANFGILIDINGDALHASVGFPPALNVATAKVRKLEIIVRNFSVVINSIRYGHSDEEINKVEIILLENNKLNVKSSSYFGEVFYGN
jgi:hypothetical protein